MSDLLDEYFLALGEHSLWIDSLDVYLCSVFSFIGGRALVDQFAGNANAVFDVFVVKLFR